MIDLNQPVSLNAFGDQFQQAIIGYCMNNSQFLMKCRANVETGWFINVIHQDLMRIIYDIYDSKKGSASSERLPKEYEVITTLNTMFPKQSDLNARKEELTKCMSAVKGYSFDWLSTQMTGWIRMIKLKYLIEDANKQFKQKQFDKCIDWVNVKMQDVKKASFMEDMYVSFKDPVAFLQKFGKIVEAECCTFGHPEMDDIIKNGSKITTAKDGEGYSHIMDLRKFTSGGLMPGDLTVLMGPTNAGKTTTVITIIAANVLIGKYVGLITHEQDSDQLRLAILAAMMQRQRNDLILNAPNSPEAVQALEIYSQMLEEHVKFVHYAVPGKMFVEDVIPLIESMQEEVTIHRSIAAHPDGQQCGCPGHQHVKKSVKGLDLLVEDYPAKLKSRSLKGAQIWDERTYVYNEFLNLGQTYRFHVLAPVQTNRAGYRVGRGDSRDSRMLDVDDVAEGFGIMTIAANVITINRSDNYKSLGVIRFHVAKSRGSETGHSVVLRTAFDRSLAFDVTKPYKHVLPGQDLSDQEILGALGLQMDPRAAEQHARQERLEQAILSSQQPSPSVPPGQPVETAPAAPATPINPNGNVVS